MKELDTNFKARVLANDQITSASALAYIITGHERHHVNIIKERYLEQ